MEEILMKELTSIQKRVLEVMEHWECDRLRSELELYIITDTDEELANNFFDDIATEEEYEAGKLLG